MPQHQPLNGDVVEPEHFSDEVRRDVVPAFLEALRRLADGELETPTNTPNVEDVLSRMKQLVGELEVALRHGSHDQSDHGNRATPDVTPRMQRRDDGSPGEQVRELVDMSAEPDDGFSVNPQTGEWPEDGYMVGGEGPEVEVTSGDKDEEAEAVQTYIETQGQALSADDQYLGGWRRPRDGAFVVDASKNVESEEEAARLAVERSEDAVFDVDSLEVIETEELADRHGISRAGYEPVRGSYGRSDGRPAESAASTTSYGRSGAAHRPTAQGPAAGRTHHSEVGSPSGSSVSDADEGRRRHGTHNQKDHGNRADVQASFESQREAAEAMADSVIALQGLPDDTDRDRVVDRMNNTLTKRGFGRVTEDETAATARAVDAAIEESDEFREQVQGMENKPPVITLRDKPRQSTPYASFQNQSVLVYADKLHDGVDEDAVSGPPEPGRELAYQNRQDLLRHEFGHAVSAEASNGGIAPDNYQQVRNELGERLGDAERELSYYATTNTRESFAEAFMIGTHPEYDPSKFSEDAQQLIDAALEANR